MDEPLVSTAEVAEGLPFEFDDDDTRECDGAIESLSDDARRYGSRSWKTQTTTPTSVVNLVKRAARRHMKNYDGFIQSRAGDEAVTWTDRGEESGSAYFTKQEISALREISGVGGGLYTASAAWGTNRTGHPNGGYVQGTVPTGQGTRMPYFRDDTASPW